jgi:hypothetical protein
MDQPSWLTRESGSEADLVLPRRFLLPYLTTLSGDQFKVMFAVYCQWQLVGAPLSFRVKPEEIGRLCDLTTGEVHRLLNQLVANGHLDAPLAPDLDGYLVTIPPPGRARE